MEPADPLKNQEQKIRNLEQELNDLRQGLTAVSDYYKGLEEASRKVEAEDEVDEEILKPLIEEDLEFEAIWRFHEEILVPDPKARIDCSLMFEAFIRFCDATGRQAVERDAFEFVFSRMENPKPGCEKGEWTGYRLRPR